MKKLWEIISEWLSNTFNFTLVKNSNDESLVSFQNGPIENHGTFMQTGTVVDLKTKEASEEFVTQITKTLKENYLVDVNNDKFHYYINQSLLVVKLNDSPSKRAILKELLLKKFSGAEQGLDDSDLPTTIALDAMRHLTDAALRRLCAFRLLTNVIPSIINTENKSLLIEAIKFINDNGLMNKVEIMDLRRLGIINDMTISVYSLEEIEELSEISALINMDEFDKSIILSSMLSPAGMELTNIALQYFLDFSGTFNKWLPVQNKSLHLKELVVDEDILANRNIAANGDVSAKGSLR